MMRQPDRQGMPALFADFLWEPISRGEETMLFVSQDTSEYADERKIYNNTFDIASLVHLKRM